MATKAGVTVGEESESDDDVPAPAPAAAAATPVANASPRAVTLGEEDESDDDDGGGDDFAALTGARSDDDGDTLASQTTSPASSEGDVDPTRQQPGFITWRHKTIRGKNRQLRRNLLGRVIAQPKMVSSKLHDLDGMLTKQQAAAQDVSDLLQVLRGDMMTLHERLTLLLTNSDFVPALHIPCATIHGLTMEEAKSRLSARRFDKVGISWRGDTLRAEYSSVGATSVLHFKLAPSRHAGAAAAAEGGEGAASIDVIETHRDITILHATFMNKFRSELLRTMSKLDEQPGTKSALLIVDVQNDFVSGSLRVGDDAESIVGPINRLRREHKFDLVVLTRDFHPPDHCSFAANYKGRKAFDTITIPVPGRPGEMTKQVLWPTHCVADTQGAAFHPALEVDGTELVQNKGESFDVDCYSAIYDIARNPTGLGDALGERGITHVFVCGLALDYCVGCTACDAAELGFRTYVIDDLCRSVSADSEAEMRASLAGAGAEVVPSSVIGQYLGTPATPPDADEVAKREELERCRSPVSPTYYHPESVSAGYKSKAAAK